MKTYAFQGKLFHFNDHIVVEMLLGVPDEKRTGRLVQVRKRKGAFMSDLLLVRLRDNTLMAFHNALIRHVGDEDFEWAFYRSNGREPPNVPPQPINEDDSEDQEYLIMEGYPETGFIVEEPKQPDDPKQSFCMMVIGGK